MWEAIGSLYASQRQKVLNSICESQIRTSLSVMPAKKTILTDAERTKRILETAREIGTDNDPESLERAFKKVVRLKGARQDRDGPKTSVPGRTSRLHQGGEQE